MSLDSMLNDLKENITFSNENFDLNSSIQIQEIFITTPGANRYSINSIDSKTKERLTNFLNLIVYKNNISSLNKIDKKIAIEVFTMIPDIPKETEAKLTSFPSLINKEIVEKVLNTELSNKSFSIDIIEKLNSNVLLLKEVKEKIQYLKNYLIEFYNKFNNKIEELIKNPLLIIVKLNEPIIKNDISIKYETLDVIKSPISKLYIIDNSTLDYEKFKNKQLSNKYYNIYNDSNLEKLLKINSYTHKYSKESVSLLDIYEIVKYIVFNELNNINKLIEDYIIKLDNIKENNEINNEILNIINLNDEIIKKLEKINTLNEICSDNENIFKKIEELLELF